MARVYLGLGSNLGKKEENLKLAVEFMSTLGSVKKLSSYFYSKAQGFVSLNDFVNQVILIESSLSPRELLIKTQLIEKRMGRLTKTAHEYSDRVIDIDILMYDSLQMNEPDLIIPHPRIGERDFVKLPLSEIYEASAE